ncbi:MAG: tandem-95 repeat protein, partial [Acidobacteria bacterium]|nr:tandem-95 repeat protein [Acidobacteriota bacterium]
MFMRRFCALGFVCLFGGGLIWAQSHEYQVLMDLDYDPATGCSIPTESGPVGGIDAILYTQVDVSTHMVTRTEWASCTGGVVGPRQLLNNGGYLLGQGLGLGAGDVLETYLPIQPLSTAGTIRVAFRVINLVDSQEDSLILTDAGGPLEIFVYVPIPTLKFWLLLLMGGLLLLVGVWFIRCQKQIPPWANTLLVLFAAILTFGFSFVITLDGDPSDWNGIAPLALDPAGDVTNPDLLAVFGTACPDALYFRFDAILNSPPTVDDQAVNLLEEGALLITLTGSDADGDSLNFTLSAPPSHGSLSGLTQVPPNSATVMYQPDPDYFGADSFQFTASDGANSSLAGTISITVDAVNDAPSFTSGGNVSVFKEQGPYDAPWATNLSAGPFETQNLTFVITANDNPSLFSAQPSISPLGNLQFTGAANQVGTANLMVVLMDDGGTANGGVDQSAPVAFSISFQGVNDPPSFTVGSNQNAFEDAGTQTVAGWATNLNDGDGGGQVLTFVVTNNTNPSLFTAGPSVDGLTGDLSFTSASDAVGSAVITLVLMDDGGTANGGSDTSAPASFTITIDPVNDAPSFLVGADPTVLEDSGVQTLSGWATARSAGPPDESGQMLTFNITGNTNPSLFASGPSLDASTGDLSFTPAADAVGSAMISVVLMDDGGTANGGVDTSSTATFAIQIDPVNDAPSFTSGGNVMFTGASVPQTISGWATNLSPGPADESGQVLTFVVTGNTNSGLFAAGPAVDGASGDLTFTPAMSASGTATITLHLMDDGGTANGGVDSSSDVSFDLSLTAQNQAPSFTAGADPTVLEDAGTQTILAWATNINDGDGGSQMLNFNVTGNTNPGLFAAGPSVNATSGDLSFTPAADAFGSATITLVLMDDGGTAGGGVDTSPSVMFTINVTSVNDAPSFTAGMDQTVLEDAGAQTVMGWATAISAGPANESGQSLTFNIVGNTNPSLFSAGPAVSLGGDLTFTSVMNGSGTATLTLELMDDGGTANGGVDTSPAVMFTITVTPVNDPPTALPDSGYATYPHVSLVVDRTAPSYAHLTSTFGDVLANDVDPDSVSLAVVTVVGSGDTSEPFTGTTTLGGSVDLYADGSFIYHPPVGVINTTDTFQYTVEDDMGLPANGTVSIDIANAEPIWFINDTVAGGGDGTAHLPFNNLSDFNASGQNDNDIIFVYAGNTGTTALDGQFFLAPGQVLHGEGNALQVVHPESMMTATLVNAGTRPVLVSTLGDIVTLDSDNQVLGLDLRPTMGAGILSGIVPMKTETALSQLSDASPVHHPAALEKG